MGLKSAIEWNIERLRLLISVLKWEVVNRFARELALNEESDVIVSLTTYGMRLRISYISIETLMHQSVRPKKIILWLAREDLNSNGELPSTIKRLQSRGLEVRIVEENIRSYKKLIYALRDFPNNKIITCDDDVFYPTDFIQRMLETSIDFPGSVVAYRCHWMTKNNGQLAPYLSWSDANMKGPSFNLFPTGCGGVLYPPSALNVEVFNQNAFMKLAPTADDVWFKAMALKNNTKAVMVHNKSVEFDLIPWTQGGALWKLNTAVENNKNDYQLAAVFNHYGLIDVLE